MNEQKIIKQQLFKNMLWNLVAFSIIFTIFSLVIYNQVKSSLYKKIDEELMLATDSVFMSGGKRLITTNNAGAMTSITVTEPTEGDILFTDRVQIQRLSPVAVMSNPRLIHVLRNNDGDIINPESMGSMHYQQLAHVELDKKHLNTIYEVIINNQYYYRAINTSIETSTGEIIYVQVFANVDAEVSIIKNFSRILAIGTTIMVVLSIVASYLLSKKSMEPVVEAWEKQTEFVQNASHELRTPLTIIQAKQALLLEEPESKIIDKSEEISLTLKETKRLGKLVKDLMLLARADSNKIELEKKELQIDNFIKEIAVPYIEFSNMEKKELKLNLNYKEKIKIDRNMIHQLLVILLDNSIKYTREKEEIEISTYSKDGKCVIEVKDTGIGISEEAISQIFDRFYREDKARNRETGGSGLGLSIAQFIVELHKGTIKISPNSPKGTIVTVKL